MKNKSFQLYNEPLKAYFQYEKLINALPLAVLVTDKNDCIIYRNKSFCNLLHQDAFLINKSMKEIVNRRDWNKWNENLFRLSNISDDESCIFNIRFNNDAGIKCLKIQGKVFQRDEHNRPSLYFFTAEDITAQFENENVSDTAITPKQGLKNYIRKTSAEKKLELTVKDLDRSNKDLEEFAYAASHDLQEPLRKITAFSTRLEYKFSEKLGEEGKLYIDKINAAAGNMRELIENLLQVSRTMQHVQPFVSTDLNKILQQVKQNLDLKIEERSVKIFEESLPVIDAIPSLMIQLFDNLLSNAIKFSSKDQAAIINISCKELSASEKNNLSLPEGKCFYEIVVRDNGIGFNQEFAKSIFKIFYRLHGKKDYQGTGIGLSICSKIVDKHKGLIWAKSKPDEGAAFYVVLPKTQDGDKL